MANEGQSVDLIQLNDVLSLLVGLWAVKIAHNRGSSAMYTYGVSLVHYYPYLPPLVR